MYTCLNEFHIGYKNTFLIYFLFRMVQNKISIGSALANFIYKVEENCEGLVLNRICYVMFCADADNLVWKYIKSTKMLIMKST